MAKIGNRVKEPSTTPGTGTLELAGAPTGFNAFADEFTTGDSVVYLLVDDPDNPTEFEYGIGTFTAGVPHTLSRDTVEGSSNGGSKVSWVSGCVAISTITALSFNNSLAFDLNALAQTLNMSGKAINEAKGANIASATTTNIWAPADGNLVHITGTVTITSLGTAPQAGARRKVIFDGALTLTHNASTLILPGGASITTAAGDIAEVIADTTTQLRVEYTKASGQAIIAPVSTGIVGALRNLRVSVAVSGKTVSWTVDEIFVETALGGTVYKGASKTFAFNGATTGANGMDTGSTPTSGDLYIYAIYNPTTDTWACLGTIAGSGATIYGGANMPSGYTASVMIWCGKTDGSGNLIAFTQRDRKIWRAKVNALTGGTATSFTSVSLSSIVPVPAVTVSGMAGMDTSTTNLGMSVASDSNGVAEQVMASATAGAFTYASYYGASAFTDLPIMTQQTLYYKVTTSGSGRIDINGYTF